MGIFGQYSCSFTLASYIVGLRRSYLIYMDFISDVLYRDFKDIV